MRNNASPEEVLKQLEGLTSKDIDPTEKNKSGSTPLSYAAEKFLRQHATSANAWLNVCERLIELQFPLRHNDENILFFLFSWGVISSFPSSLNQRKISLLELFHKVNPAILHQPSKEGVLPLEEAFQLPSSRTLIPQMLELGCVEWLDPRTQGTFLHRIASDKSSRYRHEETLQIVVQIFHQHNKLNLLNKKGKSAFDLAQENNNILLSELILPFYTPPAKKN